METGLYGGFPMLESNFRLAGPRVERGPVVQQAGCESDFRPLYLGNPIPQSRDRSFLGTSPKRLEPTFLNGNPGFRNAFLSCLGESTRPQKPDARPSGGGHGAPIGQE
jgi:hypothetical protein